MTNCHILFKSKITRNDKMTTSSNKNLPHFQKESVQNLLSYKSLTFIILIIQIRSLFPTVISDCQEYSVARLQYTISNLMMFS